MKTITWICKNCGEKNTIKYMVGDKPKMVCKCGTENKKYSKSGRFCGTNPFH